MSNTNGFKVDYLTFTFRSDRICLSESSAYSADDQLTMYINRLDEITSGFISLDKFEFFKYGRNHFNRMAAFGGGNTFFILAAEDIKQLKGFICVNISGKAINELGMSVVQAIILDACQCLYANCTRIDLAYDNYDDTIPRKKLYKSFDNFLSGKKTLESNFKRHTVQIIKGVFDNVKYTNLCFGSRQSTIFMRLYDKRAEQGIQHNILPHHLPEFWYRLELECRKEVANSVFHKLCDTDDFNVRHAWQMVLNRMFRILDHVATGSELTHVGRVETAYWWRKFVGSVDKLEVNYDPPNMDVDINKMTDHLRKYYSGYLYTVLRADPSAFVDIIEVDGSKKASKIKKYKNIIDFVEYNNDL